MGYHWNIRSAQIHETAGPWNILCGWHSLWELPQPSRPPLGNAAAYFKTIVPAAGPKWCWPKTCAFLSLRRTFPVLIWSSEWAWRKDIPNWEFPIGRVGCWSPLGFHSWKLTCRPSLLCSFGCQPKVWRICQNSAEIPGVFDCLALCGVGSRESAWLGAAGPQRFCHGTLPHAQLENQGHGASSWNIGGWWDSPGLGAKACHWHRRWRQPGFATRPCWQMGCQQLQGWMGPNAGRHGESASTKTWSLKHAQSQTSTSGFRAAGRRAACDSQSYQWPGRYKDDGAGQWGWKVEGIDFPALPQQCPGPAEPDSQWCGRYRSPHQLAQGALVDPERSRRRFWSCPWPCLEIHFQQWHSDPGWNELDPAPGTGRHEEDQARKGFAPLPHPEGQSARLPWTWGFWHRTQARSWLESWESNGGRRCQKAKPCHFGSARPCRCLGPQCGSDPVDFKVGQARPDRYQANGVVEGQRSDSPGALCPADRVHWVKIMAERMLRADRCCS